jgi:transaldolase/glucose-6-phosphate isomerase
MNPTAKAAKKQTGYPIFELAEHGQSVWLDFIHRRSIQNGEFENYVKQRGLRGVTSNPSIFEKAITAGATYDSAIQNLLEKQDLDAKSIFVELAVQDVRDVADILKPVYEESKKEDGYVSLEVSPYQARDTEGTIQEARILWKKVNRPNLMIKVPGTAEGIPAIRQLISEGINVNVTLLFDRTMYRQAAEAYIDGLEEYLHRGGNLADVASVASFFVSRIDAAVDKKLSKLMEDSTDPIQKNELQALLGKVAIANAKLAYEDFEEIFQGLRWKRLEGQKAKVQRVLWASTSTKNPKYRDVMYVEELVGPSTVNTVPPQTFAAFEDHGEVRESLRENQDGAHDVIRKLEDFGVSLQEVTRQTLEDGIQLFAEPYDKLIACVEEKRRGYLKPPLNSMELKLPILLETKVGEVLLKWTKDRKNYRLWKGDASLWSNHDEGKWLGWLTIIEEELERIHDLKAFQAEMKRSQFQEVLLLGMGGSSLCAEVLEMTFDSPNEFPNFHVLDSTDPHQIRAIQDKLPLDRTLFIVSSKSGTTLEPIILAEYFCQQLENHSGQAQVGQHFMAITDPGSKLADLACAKNFRKVFYGVPSIGGRYSALSRFGLVPGAAMGIQIEDLLKQARIMKNSCIPEVPAEDNPGVLLGAVLGTLAQQGRNKVTLILSPEIWDMSVWLEQLLAESTGKQGLGLIPISEEKIGPLEIYGKDRVFVFLSVEGTKSRELATQVKKLEGAQHPVIYLNLKGPYSIGQEFFRWEMATAVACSVLGIHPFDQPDVESSKVKTRNITSEFEKTGKLPLETPLVEESGIQVFMSGAHKFNSIEDLIRSHLDQIACGDYFAILAYLQMSLENEDILNKIRYQIRESKKIATCLEYGPRYLHSTGQLYKGGPNCGVFFMITSEASHDIQVPGHRYSFGTVEIAQARADIEVMLERKRRILRFHLKRETTHGLVQISEAVRNVLKGSAA